ncbi:MAG: CRTAC1 family protein, partial [Pseudomonadota bacterium]
LDAAGLRIGAGFEGAPLTLHTYDLYDLGAADADNDGNLDLFTVNHSARQSLLRGRGDGTFADVLSPWQLDQDRRFPAAEDLPEAPNPERPGVYVYRADRWLVIAAHALDDAVVAAGSLTVDWPLEIAASPAAVLQATETERHEDGGTTVTFALRSGERLRILGRNDIVEVPHRFRFDREFPSDRIYVGSRGLSPDGHEFELMWRDRHSMAWSDVDDDGRPDVYMGRGAIKGGIDAFSGTVADELFVHTGEKFVDVIAKTGIDKGDCPGRKAAWVDANQDSALDLYIACGRGDESGFPNQLWLRGDDGRFVDSAAELGLDFGDESTFVWLDADNDSDQDLLAVNAGTATISINRRNRFENMRIATGLAPIYTLTAADFDNDGDLDVYGAHRDRSTLFVNDRGNLSATDPASIGLPTGARTAVWVDIDNDGLLDLFTLPRGAFMQAASGEFEHRPTVDSGGSAQRMRDARAEWADLDNDGRQDAVVAAQYDGSVIEKAVAKLRGSRLDLRDRWQARLAMNRLTNDNHWLQLTLRGPKGNRESIGARVYVATPAGTQLRQVGNSDGGHYGQGHYRLYFGLGGHDTVNHMQIVWPDGRRQEFHGVAADRLLSIAYDEPHSQRSREGSTE